MNQKALRTVKTGNAAKADLRGNFMALRAVIIKRDKKQKFSKIPY